MLENIKNSEKTEAKDAKPKIEVQYIHGTADNSRDVESYLESEGHRLKKKGFIVVEKHYEVHTLFHLKPSLEEAMETYKKVSVWGSSETQSFYSVYKYSIEEEKKMEADSLRGKKLYSALTFG